MHRSHLYGVGLAFLALLFAGCMALENRFVYHPVRSGEEKLPPQASAKDVYLRLADGRKIVAEGTTEGRILDAPRGDAGFGYDPLFFSTELGMTFGEASPDAKHAVSHRGRAAHSLTQAINSHGR